MNKYGFILDEETKMRRMGENEKDEGIRSLEKLGASKKLIKLTLILLLTSFCIFISKNVNFTKLFKVTADFDGRNDLCVFIFLSFVIMVIKDGNTTSRNILVGKESYCSK